MLPGCSSLATALIWLATTQVPSLEVTVGPRAPPAGSADGSGAAGARLALAAMPEGRRLELARALQDLADRWQRRRNPLFVPLDEDGAPAEVEKLLAARLPAATAARALAQGRWQSPEGDVRVRAVARCAPGARCVGLSVGMPADPLERRARFLAWPIGYAVVAKAASDAEAARVAERARAAEPEGSRVALLLTGAEVRASRATPGTVAVTRAAARLAKALRGRSAPGVALVTDVARAGGARGGDLAWLALPAGAILAVPRLGSLAEPAAFVAEVRARLAAAAAEVEWLAAPAALP